VVVVGGGRGDGVLVRDRVGRACVQQQQRADHPLVSRQSCVLCGINPAGRSTAWVLPRTVGTQFGKDCKACGRTMLCYAPV